MEREQPKEKNTRNIHGMIVKSIPSPDEERTYFSMTVKQQQQEQLNDFIEVLNEELLVAEGHGEIDEGCYYGEYIRIASAFFKPEISNLVYTLSDTAQAIQAVINNRESDTFSGDSGEVNIQPCLVNNVNALITLMKMCKENPTATLSGEYPGGGIMKQEITA